MWPCFIVSKLATTPEQIIYGRNLTLLFMNHVGRNICCAQQVVVRVLIELMMSECSDINTHRWDDNLARNAHLQSQKHIGCVGCCCVLLVLQNSN